MDADHFRWQTLLLSLKDHQGNTALHLAVIEGMAEPVQALLQAGADINTPGLLSSVMKPSCLYCFQAGFGRCLDRIAVLLFIWALSTNGLSLVVQIVSCNVGVCACDTLCTSMQKMKQHNTGTHKCIQSDATAGV